MFSKLQTTKAQVILSKNETDKHIARYLISVYECFKATETVHENTVKGNIEIRVTGTSHH